MESNLLMTLALKWNKPFSIMPNFGNDATFNRKHQLTRQQNPGWGARPKVDMSRPSQTESVYVQTLPDGKCLCPDFRAFKILYDQTLVRSKLKFVRSFLRSKTPMFRLSCVQTCLCPDFRAFKILYDQTLVRSKWKIVRSFVRSCPDYRAFKNTHVQTFLRSKMRMSRLSCVHVKVTFL